MSKAALKADNDWHDGIIFFIMRDGKECVGMAPDEASARAEYGDSIVFHKGQQLCRYNWNHGQMLIETRDGQRASLVDTDWVKTNAK